MARERTWLAVLPRKIRLEVVSESPFENGARSASEACAMLEAQGVPMNLVTLRWFQNVGLIGRPAKEGRNALYPRPVLDELASLRVLQNLYGRSVEDLKELRRRDVSFTDTVKHLLRLEERQFPPRDGTDEKMISPVWARSLDRLALVTEFFDRVLSDGVHPGRLVLKDAPSVLLEFGRRS